MLWYLTAELTVIFEGLTSKKKKTSLCKERKEGKKGYQAVV